MDLGYDAEPFARALTRAQLTVHRVIEALIYGPLGYIDEELANVVGVADHHEAMGLLGGSLALSLNDVSRALSQPTDLPVYEASERSHRIIAAVADMLTSDTLEADDIQLALAELHTANFWMSEALRLATPLAPPGSMQDWLIGDQAMIDGEDAAAQLRPLPRPHDRPTPLAVSDQPVGDIEAAAALLRVRVGEATYDVRLRADSSWVRIARTVDDARLIAESATRAAPGSVWGLVDLGHTGAAVLPLFVSSPDHEVRRLSDGTTTDADLARIAFGRFDGLLEPRTTHSLLALYYCGADVSVGTTHHQTG